LSLGVQGVSLWDLPRIPHIHLPRFIIYTPTFDAASGGAIALHNLCHSLNALGHTALVAEWLAPQNSNRLGIRFRRIVRPPFVTSPSLKTPVLEGRLAGPEDIVVYPEITPDNPLRARNVTRWFLNNPTYFNRRIQAGPDELYFLYDQRCDHPDLTGGKARLLYQFVPNTAYQQTNFGPRQGSCYMTRKLRDVTLVHDLTDSVRVDGLGHDDLAAVFNRCARFYSYDELTSYSQFAALCGCDSIVIPHHFKTREAFHAGYPLSRFGVAFGEEDLDHARATRHRVAENLTDFAAAGQRSVADFATLSLRHFGLAR
jgi:hypothetical protein